MVPHQWIADRMAMGKRTRSVSLWADIE